MKVLMLNGSPHKEGVCALALSLFASVLEEEGVESEILEVGDKDIRGCMACSFCRKENRCVTNDLVNIAGEKLKESDGLVLASPVYFASANGTLISFLDRLFYSTSAIDKRMKVGCSLVSCRRGGASATFDELNKYFTISEMPIVSSRYWNSIHGNTREEALKDEEGLITIRQLARNMAFMMKCIRERKEKEGLPKKEESIHTNFIR